MSFEVFVPHPDHDEEGNLTKFSYKEGETVRAVRRIDDPAGGVTALSGDIGTVENIDSYPLVMGPTIRFHRTGRAIDVPPNGWVEKVE